MVKVPLHCVVLLCLTEILPVNKSTALQEKSAESHLNKNAQSLYGYVVTVNLDVMMKTSKPVCHWHIYIYKLFLLGFGLDLQLNILLQQHHNEFYELSSTLFWVKTNNRRFPSKANAERSRHWGSVFGVRHFHKVNVAVGWAEIHAVQGVRLHSGLFEGRAHLHFQLICKLRKRTQFIPSHSRPQTV